MGFGNKQPALFHVFVSFLYKSDMKLLFLSNPSHLSSPRAAQEAPPAHEDEAPWGGCSSPNQLVRELEKQVNKAKEKMTKEDTEGECIFLPPSRCYAASRAANANTSENEESKHETHRVPLSHPLH